MTDGHDTGSLVLAFGHDEILLVTRQLMLQRTGCNVALTRTMPEFRACLLSQPFQLILLCQSLSPDECESAARFAQEYAPSARLLMMFTRVGKSIPPNTDVLLDAHAGPKVFVETAQRLLINVAGHAA